MNTQPRSFLTITMRVLFGLLILFIGYRMVVFELRIRKSEKAFLQTEHPGPTERVDSLVLEVNYYPATYVDDSIQFQSAFLIGEIRSYDGNWAALETSYAEKRLGENGSNNLPVWIVPLQLEYKDQKSWIDFPDDFSFDPFQAYILQALQDHYPPQKLTERFGAVKRNIYFVYMHSDP